MIFQKQYATQNPSNRTLAASLADGKNGCFSQKGPSVLSGMPSKAGRRDFLKTSLAGGLGLWASQKTLPIALGANGDRKERILVVGAGIAGLAAAAQLHANGYEVTVVEARPRIGGRIWTAQVGQPIDLGAVWVEANPKNPVDQYCTQNGFKKVVNDEDSVRVFDVDGSGFGDAEAEWLHSHTQELLDRVQALNKERTGSNQPDITMAQALQMSDTNQFDTPRKQHYRNWAISAEVEATEAENIEQISLRNYWAEDEEDTFDASHYLLVEGLAKITSLAAQLDIRLGQPVRAINWTAKGVEVVTEKETLHADRVIVTLPIGVLKAGDVKFSPALPPEKIRAIQTIGVGAIHKVVLCFEKPFWKNGEQMLGYASEVPSLFTEWWNYAALKGMPVLAMISHGEPARRLEKMGAKAAVAEALKALQIVYKNAVTEPVESAVTEWTSDPYSRGAHAFLPIGASYEQLDILGTTVGNRLFFAGEATARQYPATVHGAWLSGLREAERIMKAQG